MLFFSAAEMAMVSLNRSRVEQKAEEGDKRYVRLLKVLENPTTFINNSSRYHLDHDLVRGKIGRYTWTSNCLLDGERRNSLCHCKFPLFGILDLYFYCFWELYPKRIALNLKDNWPSEQHQSLLVGKIVSPFVWLLSASTNLLSRLTPMTFDDADEKNDSR